jgi:hypothetical protein
VRTGPGAPYPHQPVKRGVQQVQLGYVGRRYFEAQVRLVLLLRNPVEGRQEKRRVWTNPGDPSNVRSLEDFRDDIGRTKRKAVELFERLQEQVSSNEEQRASLRAKDGQSSSVSTISRSTSPRLAPTLFWSSCPNESLTAKPGIEPSCQSSTNIIGRHYESLLKRAELPAIRLHDLRQTCATILLIIGKHPTYM